MIQGATRERVTARLAQLRETYDGFDIRQTTLSVGPGEFERACADGGGTVHAKVAVTDAAGRHLLVEEPEGWTQPDATVSAGDPVVETLRAAVADQTGLDTRIETLDEVAIVAVDCESTGESACQLKAQFTGSPAGGEVREPAAWHAELPEPRRLR